MDINTPVPPAWSQSGVPCIAMPLPAISCTIPLLPGHGERLVPCRLPLPGVVIFVHGVNSDGEWYDDAEQGLCKGLNTRLARQEAQLALPGDGTGRLIPCAYTPELDPEGFLSRDRSHANFIQDQSNWSPVIRFRWGYKATKRDIKDFGDSVFLNEDDYWGGGSFANGCSALADLWTDGLNDRLFLWLTAQHLNPVPGREVYHCPHRAYYAFAALRLARLLKSIRDKQADCPITVVCHSQGNMVGLAAAFLADRLGIQADNYVLATRRSASSTRMARKTGSSATPPTGRARAAGSAMAPASTPSPTSSNCSRPAPAASRPPNGWINTWPTRSRPTAAPASRPPATASNGGSMAATPTAASPSTATPTTRSFRPTPSRASAGAG